MTDYTPQQLADLNAAIARGAMQLKMGEEMVTFRSLDEMMRIKAIMERDLGMFTSRRHYPAFSRGT
jgi:hypothetical protein